MTVTKMTNSNDESDEINELPIEIVKDHGIWNDLTEPWYRI